MKFTVAGMLCYVCVATVVAVTPLQADEGFVCAGYDPPDLPPAAKTAGLAGNPSKKAGSASVLVLFAQFDDAEDHPIPAFADDLLDIDLPGSLSHFYEEMSFGALRISGRTGPRRYVSDGRAEAYLAEQSDQPGRFGAFVREILDRADRDIDFGDFDNDGPDGLPNSGDDDDMVDYLFVLLPQIPHGFLFGGATGIAALGFNELHQTGDMGPAGPIGIRQQPSAILQEGNFAQTAGTMAHEFAHRWGLPDLYDTSYDNPRNDSAGIGRWGLLGWGASGWNGNDGPNPMSPWALHRLGWISAENGRLREIDRDQSGVELSDTWSGGQVLKVPLQESDYESQFSAGHLLIEHRRRDASYYNRNLPAEGALIWHIRGRSNADETDKAVDLICADGLYADAGFPLGRQVDPHSGRDNLDFWAHDQAYAVEHGGNMGDATDLFDGLVYTSLYPASNPSSDPGGHSPGASSGLSINMRSEGDVMSLDVRHPTWSGTIREDVHWNDSVLVDGDLTVAPEGSLVIHNGVEVLLAGEDRQRGGLDTDRIEITVKGGLRVDRDVQFRGAENGDVWYGLIIDPADSSQVWIGSDNLTVSDATHGVVLPFVDGEETGLRLSEFRIEDVSGRERSDGGNGQLRPGEPFSVVTELVNHSETYYQRVWMNLEWTSHVGRTWHQERATRLPLMKPVHMLPTDSHRFRTQLTLSPDAAPGTRIEIIVRVGSSETSFLDTLSFEVSSTYPPHHLRFEVDKQPMLGESVRLEADRDAAISVTADRPIDDVELVAVRLPDMQPVAEVSAVADRDRLRFEANLRLDPGLYQVFSRTELGGTRVFSREVLNIFATPAGGVTSVIFLDDDYDPGERRLWTDILKDQLTELGRIPLVIDAAPEFAGIYEAVLPYLAQQRGLVIWLGAKLREEAQETFARFLEDGGRVLLSSYALLQSRGAAEFLVTYAHAAKDGYTSDLRFERKSMLRSSHTDGTMEFRAKHLSLNPQPPAVPILFNDSYRPAGLRIDTGRYRLAFLPFELDGLDRSIVRELLSSNLTFLTQQDIDSVEFQAEGVPMDGGVTRVDVHQSARVSATVEGDVADATLLVRSLPNLNDLASLPMRRSLEGDQLRFETEFTPTTAGLYQLLVRLVVDGGRVLYNSMSARVLTLSDRPVLALLGQQYSPRDQDYLKSALDDVLASLDLRADYLLMSAGTDPVYGTLLNLCTDDDKVVVWLGAEMTRDGRTATEQFLHRGGRLLAGSRTLYTGMGYDKDFDWLRSATTVSIGERQLQSVHGSQGFRVDHLALDPVPPAVPVLYNDRFQPAGLRVDDGHRLVYLPFDLRRVEASALIPLLANNLTFLAQQAVETVKLEAAGAPLAVQRVLVPVGESTAVQAAIAGQLSGLSLVARTIPDLTQVAAITMRTAGPDESGERYTAEFEPPGPGQYQLYLEGRTPTGRRWNSTESIRVNCLHTDADALVLIGDHYSGEDNRSLRSVVGSALDGVGLTASYVNLFTSEEDYLDSLLAPYSSEGRVVLWLGSKMAPDAQAAFVDYLSTGGRLFIASLRLHHSQDITGFVEDWLHVSRNTPFSKLKVRSIESSGLEFEHSVNHVSLDHVHEPAAPVLIDDGDKTAGIHLDTGEFRVAYFTFDLTTLPTDLARALLESSLPFLVEPAVLGPQLKVVHTADQVLSLAHPIARLEITNDGDLPSSEFRVVYHLLSDDGEAFSGQVPQAALAGHTTRQVPLPVARGLVEGSYRLQYGLSNRLEEDRILHLLATPAPFGRTELSGDWSRGRGMATLDYDGDGDLDLFLARRGSNLLFRNEAARFTDVADETGLAGDENSYAMALGDYNGDGALDLYLVNEGANRLFENDGTGFFGDVTRSVSSDGRTLGNADNGRGSGFFDYDLDGDLDLFLVNHGASNRLYELSEGRYRDISDTAAVADMGNGRGLAIGDYDLDGYADLFVANSDGTSKLLRNESGRFRDAGALEERAVAPGNAGSAFGDWDDDGDPDLFIANEQGDNVLFRNTSTHVGRRFVRQPLHLGRGATDAALVDYDQDGDLDLLTTSSNTGATGDHLYHNTGTLMVDASSLLGLDPRGAGGGLTHGDVDGDGDPDLFVVHDESVRMYRNAVEGKFGLTVELAGLAPNRHGIGARIEAVADGKRQTREVYSTSGNGSQTHPWFHFGMGETSEIDTLLVTWPDGETSSRSRVAARGRITVAHPDLQTTHVHGISNTPGEFRLWGGYPNPFNASTVIRYQLPRPLAVTLKAYNSAGQLVWSASRAEQPAGVHETTWDGMDSAGRPTASGMYILRLDAQVPEHPWDPGLSDSIKMVLVR